jgi:hypothetical protein
MFLFTAALAATMGPSASAQIVMDGSKDAAYGAALSIQNTNTQFGNGTTGDPINGGGGSEIDQVFARVAGGRLHVLVAGNLETNFNKLEVFIDSEAGGVNAIDGLALPGGVDPFCCGGFQPPDGNNTDNTGALQRMNSLVFDAGFTADHYVTITHGFENALDPGLNFYAASAHYAELGNGTAGQAGALGIQLAHQGRPNVLRGTNADFAFVGQDGKVTGDEFLIWQQNFGTTGAASRLQGDITGEGAVDNNDYNIWASKFGFNVAQATFGADYYAPQDPGDGDNSEALLGPALPSLAQGQLIDKTYAFGPGGATDNAGTGAITRELEFVLPPVAGTTNAASHRNMQNFVDLQMAIDNSNTAGVTGNGPYEIPTDDPSRVDPDVPGDPQNVTKGVEFSIPLSVLGNAGGTGIKLIAFVNGGGHDFLSNQVSGTGILFGNIGSLMPDFELEFTGNQFVTVPSPPAVPAAGVVPEPATAALTLGAVLALAARRRRR